MEIFFTYALTKTRISDAKFVRRRGLGEYIVMVFSYLSFYLLPSLHHFLFWSFHRKNFLNSFKRFLSHMYAIPFSPDNEEDATRRILFTISIVKLNRTNQTISQHGALTTRLARSERAYALLPFVQKCKERGNVVCRFGIVFLIIFYVSLLNGADRLLQSRPALQTSKAVRIIGSAVKIQFLPKYDPCLFVCYCIKLLQPKSRQHYE